MGHGVLITVAARLEVLPVGAEPLLRDGAEVVYNGQSCVEEIDENTGVAAGRPGPDHLGYPAGSGTWPAVIQAQGREEHYQADLEW